MDLKPILKNLPEIITTTSSALKIIKHFVPDQPDYIKARLERVWKPAQEYMREKIDHGDSLRDDWFSENQGSNRRIPLRLIEKTIKEIINDSEERKSKYVAKFYINISCTSNSNIDEATAFSYLDTIESLSWRQLCLIRLVILCENKEVDTCPIKEREQMSQNDRSRFYFISREFDSLIKSGYLQLSEPSLTMHAEPYLRDPSRAWTIEYTRRLHSLMNLCEIPMKEIVETFSLWNVIPKK